MAERTVRRHNVGSGHWYEVDGHKADGVTTLLRQGMPPRLDKWAAEKTANYALDHWDELSQQPLSERLAAMLAARWAERDRAANKGTQVHKLARQLVAGAAVDVPDELAGHVASYVRFLDDWEPDPLLVEATVVNRAVNYAGTLDLLATFPRLPGETWLLDIKTGSSVYGDTALQLAAYAYAETYLDDSGAEQPMIMPQVSAVVHVRSDGYEVYRMPLDGAIFNLFRHVAFVARSLETVRSWGQSDPLRLDALVTP